MLLIATFVSANRPLGSPQVMVTQATGPYDTYDMHTKNEVRLDQSDGFFHPPAYRPVSLPLGDWWLCVVTLDVIGQPCISARIFNLIVIATNMASIQTRAYASVASLACVPWKPASCVGLFDWLFQNLL